MSDISDKQSISTEEVNNVLNAFNFLEFSNSYRNTYSNMNKYFTPDAVNQQMKNINMNPVEATVDGIKHALNNPKDSEDILREYSMNFENNNFYYKRLLRYFSDMACFNITFDPIGVQKDSEFNSTAFKNDLNIVDDFCSRFDFKSEFSTVFKQLLRQGAYYCVLRKDGERFTLQELPSDFCKITGRHSYGLLYDFNMAWFINNYGVDINMYPPVFKKMLKSVFNNVNQKYNPSTDVDRRNATFMYWHQCSPKDGFWAWKMSPEIATILPYFSPLFSSMAFQPIVEKLQQDKYFIEASKLLVGIIGFNKDTKSGQTANQVNIAPELLGQFLGVARQGLNKQIGLVALPMESIEAVEFQTSEKNIAADNLDIVSKTSVASSPVLFATEKLNSHQSKLSSAIDANFVTSIYPMFANFVEYYVNSMTSKYKFKIRFHDVDIPDNRSERKDRFKDFATMGIVDIQLAARVLDMNAFELGRHLSMTKSMGLDKKLMPLMSLNNQTAAMQGSVGRKKIESPDNENTEASQARGSNELKTE